MVERRYISAKEKAIRVRKAQEAMYPHVELCRPVFRLRNFTSPSNLVANSLGVASLDLSSWQIGWNRRYVSEV